MHERRPARGIRKHIREQKATKRRLENATAVERFNRSLRNRGSKAPNPKPIEQKKPWPPYPYIARDFVPPQTLR